MQLAAAREQMTLEARFALQSELSRRQISIAQHSAASQTEGKWHDFGRVSVSERLQRGERQGVGDFVVNLGSCQFHNVLTRIDRKGMERTRLRKPSRSQYKGTRPVDPALLAPAAKSTPPEREHPIPTPPIWIWDLWCR
jgi:hypothetical protein